MNAAAVGGLLRRGWWVLALAALAGGLLYFRPAPVLPVVSARVQEVVEMVVVSGQLRAVREARLGVETGGTVAAVAVREGDSVQAGDLLVRVQMADYEQQVAQAEARRLTAEKELALAESDRELAEREAVRLGRLFALNVIAEDEQDRAVAAQARTIAAVEAARARLRDAVVQVDVVRRQAEKREVRAPFAGLVVRRVVEPGQSVTPGEALVWVAEVSRQEIFVETDENNLAKLRVGQRAVVVAPAYRDRPFAATLSLIGPRVDWERGLIGLRFTPESLPDYSRPNMTVDVSIEVRRWAELPALPAAAVLRDRTGPAVLVLEGDQLRRRPVKVLGENPQWVVVEGVPAGTRVAATAATAREGKRYQPAEEPAR